LHRERLRAQGLRPIQIWVPDVRARSFVAAARKQSKAVAASERATADQQFIDIYLAHRDGLFGASRLTLRVALAGDRRRCPASSNRLFVCRRFELISSSCGRRLVQFD
jgi:hypothetical protein